MPISNLNLDNIYPPAKFIKFFIRVLRAQTFLFKLDKTEKKNVNINNARTSPYEISRSQMFKYEKYVEFFEKAHALPDNSCRAIDIPVHTRTKICGYKISTSTSLYAVSNIGC